MQQMQSKFIMIDVNYQSVCNFENFNKTETYY